MDTYKKKYEEALEKARNIVNSINVGLIGKDSFEAVFPELAESEDGRIMKEIKDFFSRIMLGQENFLREDYDWNAWIAWLEKQTEHANFRNKIQIGDKVTRNKDGVLVNLSQLNRKIAKQTNPKFKIEDAEKKELKKIIDEKQIKKNLQDNSFRRMFEQKPIWSEKDEYILFHAINDLKFLKDTISIDPKYAVNITNIEREINLLKSIKDRVQPEQGWNKEDERTLKEVITNYESGYLPSVEKRDEIIEKLESLKERYTWKPSDEQMKVLEELVEDNNQRHFYTILKSLYEQLKKL